MRSGSLIMLGSTSIGRIEVFVTALGAVTDNEYRELTLTGQLNDGTDFIATDCIRILHKVPKGPKPKGLALTVTRTDLASPTVQIEYSVPEPMRVSLTVIDISGRVIDRLVSESVSGGLYRLSWSTDRLPSGMYFVRLLGGDQKAVQRVILQH